MKKYFLIVLLIPILVEAQFSNVLYFMDNSPYQYKINPAIMPQCRWYMSIPALSYMSGQMFSTLSLENFLKSDPVSGKMTTISSTSDFQDLFKTLSKKSKYSLSLSGGVDVIAFGWRTKRNNFFRVNLTVRTDIGIAVPKEFFDLSTKHRFTGSYDLSKFKEDMCSYVELGVGGTYPLGHHWTIGGTFKVLVGMQYLGMTSKRMTLDFMPQYNSTTMWRLDGKGKMYFAGFGGMPLRVEDFSYDYTSKANDFNIFNTPSGIGFAVDLGATFSFLDDHARFTCAVTDLGFITWYNEARKVPYELYGKLDVNNDLVLTYHNIIDNLRSLNELDGTDAVEKRFGRMISTKLNLGIDFNFCNDKIGVGLFSKTLLHGVRVQEELTLGVNLTPAKWFNFALTYSFVQSGKNGLGAGISIMTGDRVQLFVLADYIPLKWSDFRGEPCHVPTSIRSLNLSAGLAIVFNNPKKEKHKSLQASSTYMIEGQTDHVKNTHVPPYLVPTRSK